MGEKKAKAGLICGIIGVALGFFCGFLSIVGLPVSIVGLCLSVSGGKQMKAEGLSTGIGTAGLVVGIVAVVISAVTFLACGLCIICLADIAANGGM